METKSTTNTIQKGLDRNIDRVSERAHRAVDRASDVASSAAERLGDTMDHLSEKRDELMELPETWLEGARDYVREHPLASLGIAIAAGYIFSMMMRSK